MGMSVGSEAGPRATINMTPMIDVLLVLIIIFMVIAPQPMQGLDALVPQVADSNTPPPPAGDIVVTVRSDKTVLLNREPLTLAALENRLISLFRNGAANVVFVRAEKDLQFEAIAEVIDVVHGAGVYRVALMTT